jgi:hypothetical protein
MSLLDLFNTSTEKVQQVGKVEVSEENLASMFTGIMSSMGLTNPTGVTTTSSKAVSVSRKGNTYVITLNHYNPPITFTWTGLLPSDKLSEVIKKLIEDKKRINYINNIKTGEGDFIQLGIS